VLWARVVVWNVEFIVRGSKVFIVIITAGCCGPEWLCGMWSLL
jgi:hypothetical protein